MDNATKKNALNFYKYLNTFNSFVNIIQTDLKKISKMQENNSLWSGKEIILSIRYNSKCTLSYQFFKKFYFHNFS